MRYRLTSLLCLVLFVTSVTCIDDGTSPEPDADGETGAGEEEDQGEDDQPESDTDVTTPQKDEPQDAVTTTGAPGAATCIAVTMATVLSISLLQRAVV